MRKRFFVFRDMIFFSLNKDGPILDELNRVKVYLVFAYFSNSATLASNALIISCCSWMAFVNTGINAS